MLPATPALEEMAATLAERYPLPPEFVALAQLDPADPDAEAALGAILATQREARVRLREIGRSLGDAEVVARDLESSLVRYGYRGMHTAALVSVLFSNMEAPTNALDSFVYWQRAVCTAFGVSLLTPLETPESGAAAAAGLLHEIGFYLLDVERPDLTARLPTLAVNRVGLHADAERAVLGYAMHELTAVILRHWRMPATIIAAILERERPTYERGRLGTAVWTVAADAATLGFGCRFYARGQDLDPRFRRAIESFYGSSDEFLRRLDRVLAGVMLSHQGV